MVYPHRGAVARHRIVAVRTLQSVRPAPVTGPGAARAAFCRTLMGARSSFHHLAVQMPGGVPEHGQDDDEAKEHG